MNKNILAVNVGKSVALGLKFFKVGSGTSMPGIIAKKFSPNILSDLINQTKKEIITVTGTNGKTTTSNFISQILKSAGRKVANNAEGANMLTGITTAMIENANCFAKLDADNSVLESDEAYLKIFADYFCADYLLVTNLFRDQLDRYGELDATAKMINTAIEKFKAKAEKLDKTFNVVLNADVPSIQCLADENTTFFGFDDIKFSFNHNSPNEDVPCKCGRTLKYSKNYYGQVGHYYCECGFKRPETYLKATAEVFVDYSVLNIKNPETNEEFTVTINVPGIYNAYNALGAITIGIKLGIKSEDIIKAFNTYKTVFGRADNQILKGKKTITQLIKNPVGANEVLQTVNDDDNARVLIIINDNFGDGRDVSWLWDANFEILQNNKKEIVVSGIRCLDMAVRLKYAGINEQNIIVEPDLKKALLKSLDLTKDDEKLYILPCYTAMLDIYKLFPKL